MATLHKQDWINIVKSVAPTLGTVLGGPLMGTATKILSQVLFGSENENPEFIQKTIEQGLTPEQLLAIKKADQEFLVKMKELDFKLEEIEVIDRSSARDREKTLGRWASLGINTIGVFVILGFFTTVYWVFNSELTTDPSKLILIGSLVGYVSAKADQVIAYFFGSSVGSKQKTNALADALGDSIRSGAK